MELVSGLIYQYFFICKKKMWYYYHGISFENDNVKIGKIIDETSYKRERKHILIDECINVDFINGNIVCEVKKSSKQLEASVSQLKYYLYILRENGVKGLKGELKVPKENKIEKVELTENDIVEIEKNLFEINKTLKMDKPPICKKRSICRNCAYYEFCYI